MAVTSGFRIQEEGFVLICRVPPGFPIENIGTGPDQEHPDQKHRDKSGQVKTGHLDMRPPEGQRYR